METYTKIYRLMVNIYSSMFPKQPDETAWVIADSVDDAMTRLRAEYPGATTSGITSIFGCVLTADNFDYCAEVYEIGLSLRNGAEVVIHVLANNISDATDLYTTRYPDVVKAKITTLTGTVIPKNK